MLGIDKFMEVYEEELAKLYDSDPVMFAHLKGDGAIIFAGKLRAEIVKGNGYNKDGRAFKAAVKRLGIKNTYAEIDIYLGREI